MPTKDLEKRRAKCRRSYLRNHFRWKLSRCAYQKRHPEAARIHKATKTMLIACFRERHKHFFADKLLGCTPEFFRGYVEAKFQPGMTWENRNEWHMDHIRPLSSFDFAAHPEDIFRAAHYTNLQPMWAKEHLIKGSRYAVVA